MNLRTLKTLSTTELQARFWETFGQTTPSRNRPWLIKRLAAAPKDQAPVQVAVQGAPSLAPQPEAAAPTDAPTPSADESPASTAPEMAMPPVGSEIRRTWHGQDLVVQVQAEGFLLNGTVYRSLSAAATALCGGNRNGLVFFGLKPRPAKTAPVAAGVAP